MSSGPPDDSESHRSKPAVREEYAELPLWIAAGVIFGIPVVDALRAHRPFGTGLTLTLLALLVVVVRVAAMVRARG